MREMLQERKDIISGNPDFLKNPDNWININRCFYTLRNRLERMGYDIKEKFPGKEVTFLTERRKRIIADIKEICDNWYGEGRGIKRIELGITADSRSTFTFGGDSHEVKYNKVKGLAELGTDIILAEKPDILEKLAPFAEKFGVALLTSSGNYVEYAMELCDAAHEQGCNVFILGDLDISAIAMTLRLPYAKHLGLDLDALRILGIKAVDVDEPYRPSDSQYDFVEDKLRAFKGLARNGEVSDLVASGDYIIGGENADFDTDEYEDKSNIIHYNVPLLKKLAEDNEYWNYVKERRIEIDLFISDDNFNSKVFWDYLVAKMLSFYPNRDYTRAFFEFPGAFDCNIISKHTSKLYSMTQPIVEKRLEDTIRELENYEGFTDIKEKYNDVTNDSNDELKANSLVMELMRELGKVINQDKYKSLIPPSDKPAA